MKKLSALIILFLLSFLPGYSQTLTPEGEIAIAPLMLAQGFAFQGKDFRTVRIAIIEQSNDKNRQNQETQQKLSGMLLIGGYEYKISVVIFDTAKIEADLFCLPENSGIITSDTEKNELPVPVGHISLSINQPDPQNLVWLGSLRLKDEKAETVSGEFELYLNDQTPKGKKSDETPIDEASTSSTK
jgi:hypothetical protein